MNIARFGRRFAVAAVTGAIAVSLVGVGSAQAGVADVRSSVITKRPTTATLGPAYLAPTANLTKLANALQLKHKSITTLITAPAGLGITNPVTIGVSYDNSSFATQSYVNAIGNRFLYNFPSASGQALYKPIYVTLSEQVAAGQTQRFTLTWNPLIEPLFDVRLSALTFHLNNGCDLIGSSEPVVEWLDPKGTYGEADYSLDGGDTITVNAFARSYFEVGQSQGLKHPSLVWYEDDPFSVGAVPPAQSFYLFPGSGTYTYNRTLSEADGQGCSANLSYSLSETLRTYYYL